MVKNGIVLAAALLAATLCGSAVARNESLAVEQVEQVEQVAESYCTHCGNPPDWSKIRGVCAHWMSKEGFYNIYFMQSGGDFKQCGCCRAFANGPYGSWESAANWKHYRIDDEVECYYHKDHSNNAHVDGWYWNTGLNCKSENKNNARVF